MKLSILLAAAMMASTQAYAASKQLLQGSDTMAGLLSDAITAAGMDQSIGYVGGGSGNGETAIVHGEQGITAMSRAAKPEAVAALKAKGINLDTHVVALDGVGIFVHNSNAFAGLTLEQVRNIFTCAYTDWSQVKSAKATGAIRAFRRDDHSGTTDTVKNLVGIKAFGACVTVVNDTNEIADRTSSDLNAIGYAGLSAKRATNLPIAIAKTDADAFVQPTVTTVRNSTYPLSRKLYIYSISGAAQPNAAEAQLLEKLLDRSFLDPIVQSNEFYTID